MNRIMPKLLSRISLIFTLLLAITFTDAKAQSLQILNCFQKIQLSNGKNVKLLNVGGAPRIFYRSAADKFPYFRIRRILSSGGLEDVPFDLPVVDITDAAGNHIIAYENAFPQLGFLLPSAESLVMDFYGYSPTYNSLSITVDFIGVDEAFKFEPLDQSCLTFNDLQIKDDVTILEGLCYSQIYNLTLPSGAPNRMGLPDPYCQRLFFDNGTGTNNHVDMPVDQNECTNSTSNSDCPSNVSCGCINFNMEITLTSCQSLAGYEGCPDKLIISKPVRICCRCGIPDNDRADIPTLGRNTAGTALSGENSELTIFPNPNQSGKLQVSASGHPVQSIKIYAVDGKLVKSVTVKEAANQVSVDVSNLQPGMYQVKVMDNANKVSNKKLVIQ